MATKRAQTKDNHSPAAPDLAGMTVAELRSKAKEMHISGAHGMRKEELVHAIGEAGGRTAPRPRREGDTGGGVRRGSATSESLKYAQEITSPGDAPERPGRSLVTTNHDVIRRWAEERDAAPATVEGTEHDDHLGVLRLDFPGYGGGGRLRRVAWDEWFETFDERGLNFIYQEERSDGTPSNFFRLENPNREDA
ncbi:Rho termination factor N-terminal domain-containing protein [Actinokineospora sp. NPDC004072]